MDVKEPWLHVKEPERVTGEWKREGGEEYRRGSKEREALKQRGRLEEDGQIRRSQTGVEKEGGKGIGGDG